MVHEFRSDWPLRDYETFTDALRLLTESRLGRREAQLLGRDQQAASGNRAALAPVEAQRKA